MQNVINTNHVQAEAEADMEKGTDTRTLSTEIFENCGNFLIVEDYAPLFSEDNLFLWKCLMKHLIFGIFIAYK